MNDDLRRRLMAAPYVRGGRGFDGIDCLGVVILVLDLRGTPIGDPWQHLRREWEAGRIQVASALPEGWERMPAGTALLDGDVLVRFTDHSGAMVVHDGFVWSAHPQQGVWRRPVARFTRRADDEVWRCSRSTYDAECSETGTCSRQTGRSPLV